MSEELKEKVEFVQKQFEDFTNFIELADFRSFLLFTLTSQVPTNILAQMGLGGNKEVINLPYNPILKIYYQKINLISSGSLIIYVKTDPISEKFIIQKDDPKIKEFLNSNEINLAFRGKEKFLLPMISDCTTCNDENNSKLTIKVDDLFHSLESFMAVAEPNLLFVLNAKNTQDPDILFTFNMMPVMPSSIDKKILKIDIFIDKEHKTKGITYVKREEDFIIKYLSDIKDVSHSDIYKSAYSLLLHLKSFNKP
jgi:hypothetical protein